MKTPMILAVFTFAALLSACKKDSSPSQNSNPQTTFKFTANGTLYEWDSSLADNSNKGAEMEKQTDGKIILTAKDLTNNGYNKFSFDLVKNASLSTATYSYTGINTVLGLDAECTLGTLTSSQNYWNATSADNISVIISKIENGYVTGTFSAALTANGGSGSITITQGAFSNVKIVQ